MRWLPFAKKMNDYGLLPGIVFKIVYSANWVILNGTKYCKQGILAVSVTGENHLPEFGTIEQVYIIGDFVYFKVILFRTSHFEFIYQAYLIEEQTQKQDAIVAYESLVDYNIFHKIHQSDGKFYVPVKYDINDLMEEHLKGSNPLF